jgi:hypothetical protein
MPRVRAATVRERLPEPLPSLRVSFLFAVPDRQAEVGQTIVFRCLSPRRLSGPDRRQKTIVCPTVAPPCA